MFDSSRFPSLAALLISNPERAHVLLGPIELVLAGESDVRIAQAMRWASALGLRAEDVLPQIPEIPVTILQPRGELNLLTLVPFHLGNVGLAKAAGLKHAEYGYTDKTLVPADKTRYGFSKLGWRWVLAHDGSQNLNRKPTDCLAECTGPRFAGVDKVGVAIYFIHGPRGHVMDLPASVHAGGRGRCAYVHPFGVPELRAFRDAGIAYPKYGSVFFVWE
ncbi:MAG: hypothetical protein AAB473_02105 [Patescibacteria group bacterium]